MTGTEDSIKHFTTHVTDLMSEILYDALAVNTEEFGTLLKLGAIYVNKERQTKDRFVASNSSFRVHTNPRRFICDFPWSKLIVFENDFFLVLNKPSGIPSHPSVDNVIENSLTQTSLARKVPLFITHRLDSLTSGLIVYGKKQSFVRSFNIQLQERSIRKKYAALVESTQIFPKKLTHYMDPAAGTPKKLSQVPIEGWQICELEILAQKEIAPNLSWIKINLLTGKTHQIRSQLAHLQAPILGDSLYGASLPYQQNAIALRSCEIEFNCFEERMKFDLSETYAVPNPPE